MKWIWGFLAFLLVTGCFAFWLFKVRAVSVGHISKTDAQRQLPKLERQIDSLLKKYVDKEGMVDYSGLRKGQDELDRLLAIIAQVSPNSDPTLFPTQKHQLAYWLNAYNLSVLKNVLRFPDWKDIYSYSRKVRFFYLSAFYYGGKRLNLYDLENGLIRPVFKDPRIHFALNCASHGCPKLPSEAFTGDNLEKQLNRETIRFLLESRNIWVDNKQKFIYLSGIFEWFREDFINWLKANKIQMTWVDPMIVYINRFLPKEKQLPKKTHLLRYSSYDWKINDQKGSKRLAPSEH